MPVLTPRLSAYWVHWITPISASMAHPLIQGLRNEVIVRDRKAQQLFPGIVPLGYAEAVRQALAQLEAGQVETSWSDAARTSHAEASPVVLTIQEGMIIERRQRIVTADRATVYGVFTGLGGRGGWLYANWAWLLRGVLDRLLGGVGYRRGRRHAAQLRVGDALDCWRVEAIEPDHVVRLRAEMKLPGRAWLQFRCRSQTGRDHLAGADSLLRPERPARPAVLVPALPGPCPDLLRPDPRDCTPSGNRTANPTVRPNSDSATAMRRYTLTVNRNGTPATAPGLSPGNVHRHAPSILQN